MNISTTKNILYQLNWSKKKKCNPAFFGDKNFIKDKIHKQMSILKKKKKITKKPKKNQTTQLLSTYYALC